MDNKDLSVIIKNINNSKETIGHDVILHGGILPAFKPNDKKDQESIKTGTWPMV